MIAVSSRPMLLHGHGSRLSKTGSYWIERVNAAEGWADFCALMRLSARRDRKTNEGDHPWK